MTYYDKRQAEDGSKIDTVAEAISRWAPAIENNVNAYVDHVAEEVGADPREILDFNEYSVMRGLVTGIIAHENKGHRYPEPVLEEGLRRAGFVPKVAKKAVPLSVETAAGAAAPIIVGAIQVMPEVVELIKQQEENLTSGDVTRMLFGILLIVTGTSVAWSQYKRRAAGAA